MRSKVTPRKVGVGSKRRREPSKRRLGWRLAWWGSTKKISQFSKVFSSFRFKIPARKAKSCIKLDRRFQPIPTLIPRSNKASFLGPKHAYRIRTQPNLLRVVNSQTCGISRFRLLTVLLAADVVGAQLQLLDERRPHKLSELLFESELCNQSPNSFCAFYILNELAKGKHLL